MYVFIQDRVSRLETYKYETSARTVDELLVELDRDQCYPIVNDRLVSYDHLLSEGDTVSLLLDSFWGG